jgi:hypothetical protein
MNWKAEASTTAWKLSEWLKGLLWRLRDLYHPENLKQKGLIGSAVLLLVTALLIAILIGMRHVLEQGTRTIRRA